MGMLQIFKCDLCEREWRDDSGKPYKITVTLSNASYPSSYATKIIDVMWCRDCCIEKNIFMPQTNNSSKEPPFTPTTEDKIIGILEEMGFVRGEE